MTNPLAELEQLVAAIPARFKAVVLLACWCQLRKGELCGLRRRDLHLRDLRHTGNTWAAATGVSTRELMARMGHASSDAALRYQHATEDRDRIIAEALASMAKAAAVIDLASRKTDARSE